MAQTDRIKAVDLARGVALIGMMFTHIGPRWTGENPPIGDMLAGGRAAPLFAMLAGVSLTIVHQRDPDGAGSTRATWIRGALLIALGLALGSLDEVPVVVILTYYGVAIVLVLPFRRLSESQLFVVGTAWVILAPIVVLWARRTHEVVFAGQTEWSDMRHPGELIAEVAVWGAYPMVAWIGYVLIGLAVGRLDLRGLDVAWRLVVIGAVLTASTLAAGWAAIRAGVFDDRFAGGWRILFMGVNYPNEKPQWNELLLVGQHTTRPLGMLSAIGSALLAIGLCALLLKVPWLRFVAAPVRAAGAMTLTLYTVHVLWSWRLQVKFLDAHPAATPTHDYGDWMLQVVVLCAAAALWSMLIGKGPLEWLVRRLSVWPRHEKSAPKGA